jgi:hypothetical protein
MTISHQFKHPYSLKQFKKDGFSLAVFKCDRLIFHSREKNLRPLVKFITKFGWRQDNLVMYDKYIGRAAALLFVGLEPQHIYSPIISKAAIPILKKNNVEYSAKKIVPHLMGVASQGTCVWEKMSVGHTTASFWRLVKKRIIR